MRITHLSQTLVRIAAALLTVAGLLAGLGMRSAAAQTPPAPPTLTKIEPTATGGLRVGFVDNSSRESGFRVNIYTGGGQLILFTNVARVEAFGQAATREVAGLEPSTFYCVRMVSYIGDGNNGSSVFSTELAITLCATTVAGT